MSNFTEFAKDLAKGYVSERGIKGTLEDAGDLINGAAKLGKTIFGKNDKGNYNSYEDEDYEDEANEPNWFDKATWEKLCDDLEAAKEEGDYDGALQILNSYYERYEVEREYWYCYWKANILIAKYRYVGPQSNDFTLECNISNAIQSCAGRRDEEKDFTKELREQFQDAKEFVSWIREWKFIFNKVQELGESETVINGSKINDAEKLFLLVADFPKKYPGQIEVGDVSYLKSTIYNALFFALSKREQELKSLTDSQLYIYFADAEECAKKNIERFENNDEGKTDGESLYLRIQEQIEELKQLRGGKASYTDNSASLDDNEKEYLEEVKACLEEDGEISGRERRLLDRLRSSLGISEARAKELEASLSSISEEEKEYLEELKACMEDGQVSNRERRLLDKLRKSLNISEARAKELESSL